MTQLHIAAFFAASAFLMILDALVNLWLKQPRRSGTSLAVAAVCGLVFVAIFNP